jgi:hypothetical protein
MVYRMRFLWPDEIDADRAHYEELLEKWGSDDDMEHAFGGCFGRCPSASLASHSIRRQGKRRGRKPQCAGSGIAGSMAGWATRYSITGLRIA